MAADTKDTASAAQIAAGRVSERDHLQQAVEDCARLLGWKAYHTRDSRRSDDGFPDLCCVRGDRVLFAELKTATGRLTEAQAEWLAWLGAVPGIEVVVWRPVDWLDGTVEAVLR